MKRIIFLVTLLVLFTGCSIKNINDSDINDVIEFALSSEDDVTNIVSDGYKFYLPRGIKVIDKKNFNYELLSNETDYYLYVDLISYYHKVELDYTVNKNSYFSKKLSYNGKNGYIEIDNYKDDKYYLKIFYNYAKIETYIDAKYLNTAIYDSIKILSSVVYNDTIIETLVGEYSKETNEEEFSLFDSKRKEGTFLDYIEEYDVYKGDDNEKDEDFLNA